MSAGTKTKKRPAACSRKAAPGKIASNWPTPNEHGVYLRGVKTVNVPIRTTTRHQLKLSLVQVAADQWQVGYDYRTPLGGGCGGPSVKDKSYPTREAAIAAQAQRIANDWRKGGDPRAVKAAEDVEKFIATLKSADHATNGEAAGKLADQLVGTIFPPKTPAQPPVTYRENGWFYHGPDVEADEDLLIRAHELLSDDTLARKRPTIRGTLEVQGKRWACVGRDRHVNDNSETFHLVEVVPLAEWRGVRCSTLDTQHRRGHLYDKLEVSCGREKFVCSNERLTLIQANGRHSSPKHRDPSYPGNVLSTTTPAGIAALDPSATPGKRRCQIDVTLIEPNPFQPRQEFNEDELQALAANLDVMGMVSDIVVRPHPTKADVYQLIDGERRWRAARIAKWVGVPAIVRQATDQEMILLALATFEHRKDLSPIEQAEAWARAVKPVEEGGAGLLVVQLQQRMGCSESHVRNTIRLAKLTEPWRSKVISGEMSPRHARELLSWLDYPDVIRHLKKVWADHQADGATPTTEQWQRAINAAAWHCSMPMHDLPGIAGPFFVPTDEEQKQLDIVELCDPEIEECRAQRAMNIELYQRLDRAARSGERERREPQHVQRPTAATSAAASGPAINSGIVNRDAVEQQVKQMTAGEFLQHIFTPAEVEEAVNFFMDELPEHTVSAVLEAAERDDAVWALRKVVFDIEADDGKPAIKGTINGLVLTGDDRQQTAPWDDVVEAIQDASSRASIAAATTAAGDEVPLRDTKAGKKPAVDPETSRLIDETLKPRGAAERETRAQFEKLREACKVALRMFERLYHIADGRRLLRGASGNHIKEVTELLRSAVGDVDGQGASPPAPLKASKRKFKLPVHRKPVKRQSAKRKGAKRR